MPLDGKVHVGVSAELGRIVASALTSHDEDDAGQTGPLLDQVTGPVGSFIGDSAYDQEGVYADVAERWLEAAIIVPPRSTAVPSKTAGTAPTQRDRHLQHIAGHGRLREQKVSGYTNGAGLWLTRDSCVAAAVIRSSLVRMAEGAMGAAVSITRDDLDAAGLRRAAARTHEADAPGGCWPWHWCWMGARGARRPRCAAWTARRSGTGCIARSSQEVCRTTPKGWPGCPTGRSPGQAAPRPRAGGRGGRVGAHRAELGRARRHTLRRLRHRLRRTRDRLTVGAGIAKRRWRRRDLAGVIERRFGAVLAERSVGALLKRLGFRRLSVRPRHPSLAIPRRDVGEADRGHDAQAQASFRPGSPPS